MKLEYSCVCIGENCLLGRDVEKALTLPMMHRALGVKVKHPVPPFCDLLRMTKTIRPSASLLLNSVENPKGLKCWQEKLLCGVDAELGLGVLLLSRCFGLN